MDYWSILPPSVDQTRAELDQKAFHVFHVEDVISTIVDNIQVVNSKARNRTQRDDQKVVFRTGKVLGEIEIRTDRHNYRRAKMWFLAAEVLRLLTFWVEFEGNPHPPGLCLRESEATRDSVTYDHPLMRRATRRCSRHGLSPAAMRIGTGVGPRVNSLSGWRMHAVQSRLDQHQR